MTNKDIVYYKKLAHMISKTDKSQGPQLASWRPRRANGISSSLKGCRLETQQELMFHFSSDSWKRHANLSPMPSTYLYACPPETNASFRCCRNARPSKRGRFWAHSARAAATISLRAAKPRRVSRIFLSDPLNMA